MYQHFSAVFPLAVHLHCFLHFGENLEDKLRKLHIPPLSASSFLHDIPGNPAQLELGLVDAKSEDEVDAMLSSLKDTWNQCELPFNNPPTFHSWWFIA